MDGMDPQNQSLPELISSLTEQMSRLVRAELALARAELFANARQAVVGGGLLSAAAVVGLTAWLAMVAAAIAGIAEGLPVWAGALIAGGALAMLAGILAVLGRARLRRGMPPLPMTAGTVRRDLHELTRHGHSHNGAGDPVPAQRTALNGTVAQEGTRR
ncbi:MAG TPA: phage holin family protein [Trebonia sp.]|nr:phage holin family protein [Trebonia sp.]